MELKVWVEGIQRIVCGVTVNTTCQDVVFALAHATGKVGRFTLIERWRNNERLLAPNENPLKLLLKWGEYANDVQFILQRSESKQQQQQHLKQETQQQQLQQNTTNNNNNNNSNNIINNNNNNESTTVMLNKKPLGLSNINNNNNNNNNNSNLNKQNNNNNNNSSSNTIDNALNANTTSTTTSTTTQQHQKPLTMELSLNAAHERAKELKKTFGVVHDAKYSENIGIVKGIPQRSNNNLTAAATKTTPTTTTSLIPRHEKSHSNPIEMPSTASSANSGLGNFDAGNISFKGNGAYHEENNNSNNNHNNTTNNIYQQLGAHNSKSINEINLAEVRNALDRRTMLTTTTTNTATANTTQSSSMGGSAEIIFSNTTQPTINMNNSNQSNENLLDIFNGNTLATATNGNNSNNNNGNSKFSPNSPNDLYKQATTISANGALVPPPYRDPPPPRNSPLQQQLNSNFSSQSVSPQHPANALYSNQPISPTTTQQQLQQQQQQSADYADYADYQQINDLVLPTNMDESESIFQATQYNDLLQLIKFQREKINQQQMELTKYDAEIVYLESKERDQAQELEAISREITKADHLFRQGSEQLQTLQYVEEENELVKQQEKTLKSEIALLRSKLANCETELLQCKNKIRLLMDDIEIEQRAITNSKQNIRQNVERDFLMEMERIQSEIDQAIHNTDSSNKTAESLKKEIMLIETAIAEKKRQVEQLVNEMKEVNLQSLTVTTSEEIKHLLEGSNKPGSSRRIIGSPRQLENAVPTSKNPHGVWV